MIQNSFLLIQGANNFPPPPTPPPPGFPIDKMVIVAGLFILITCIVFL